MNLSLIMMLVEATKMLNRAGYDIKECISNSDWSQKQVVVILDNRGMDCNVGHPVRQRMD